MDDPYTVTVRYTIGPADADSTDCVQRVRIIPGYTTEADIPAIIAVSRTGRSDDAVFVNVKAVTR